MSDASRIAALEAELADHKLMHVPTMQPPTGKNTIARRRDDHEGRGAERATEKA